MKKTQHVVKRLSTGKQVSKMTRKEWLVLSDYLSRAGRGGGIVDLLLPRNATEQRQLIKDKKRFIVTEVKRRETENPRTVFRDTAFLVAIFEWWLKATSGTIKFTNDALAERLAHEQTKIAEGSPTRDSKLEEIFEQYNPDLITIKRTKSWWMLQLRQRRYMRK